MKTYHFLKKQQTPKCLLKKQVEADAGRVQALACCASPLLRTDDTVRKNLHSSYLKSA